MKNLLHVLTIVLLFAIVTDAGNKKVKIEDERNLEAKIAKMYDPSSPWTPWRLGQPIMEQVNFRSASQAGGALWVSGGVLPATGTPLKHFAWYIPSDKTKGHTMINLPIAPTSATSTSVRFSSISAANDSVAIVGLFTGSIIRTENRGAKWDTVRIGGTGGFNDGVRFLNKDTAIAFGDMEDSLLWIGRSVNGGKNWTRLSVRPTTGFVDGNEVSADSAYKIFKIYDWASASSASTMSVYKNTVWLQSYSSSYTQPPLVLKSTDAGATWQVITGRHKFGTRGAISTIYFVNDSLGFVTSGGGISSGGLNSYRLYKSTNGGRTWGDSIAIEPFSVPAADQNPYSVSAVPGSSTIWCYGYSAATGSKTWKSTDQGITWTAVNTPGLSNLNGGVFTNDSIGMAWGYKNLLQYRPSVEYTFTVNTATVPDTLKSNSFIQIRGDKFGWNTNEGPRLTNIGGDYWSVKLRFRPSDTLNYKFFTNVEVQTQGSANEHNGWEKDIINSTGNRILNITNSDSILPIQYVNGSQSNQYQNWKPFRTHSADSIGVMFRVNMQGVPDYKPSEHKVGVRGGTAPLDWGNSFILTQEKNHGNGYNPLYPGNNFWSGVVYFKKPTANETLRVEYKFVRHALSSTPNSDPQLWEDINYNRTFSKYGWQTMSADTTLYWKWFSDKTPKPVVTGNITFNVDLKPYIDMGVFDPTRDTLFLHGAFNGWGHSDYSKSFMQNINSTNKYERTFIGWIGSIGEKLNYKFFISQKDPGRPKYNSGWELPLSAGGGNRELIFEGTTNQSIKKYYNDVYPGNLIPANHTIKLNLKMDMRPAIKSGTPKFRPGFDILKTEYSIDDWNEGIRTVVNYSDPDGDSIYSATINYTTTKLTPNALMYSTIYTGGTAEGGGFDFGRYRVRYIMKTTSGAWPTEFTFPTDVYTQAPPLPVETNPYPTDAEVFTKYLISASSGPNGTISPSGDTLILNGLSITYTITANSGYMIDSVIIDGVQNWSGEFSSATTHTFANVSAPHTIKVVFAIKKTFSESGFQTITTTDYDYGTNAGHIRNLVVNKTGDKAWIQVMQRDGINNAAAPENRRSVLYAYIAPGVVKTGYPIPKATAQTGFGGIDVTQGAPATLGFVVGHTPNWYGLESAPGSTSFASANFPATMKGMLDPQVSWDLSRNTIWVTSSATPNRDNIELLKTSDFGQSFQSIDTAMVTNKMTKKHYIAGAIHNKVEVGPYIQSGSKLSIFTALSGTGAIAPTGSAHVDSADQIGYFSSSDGTNWTWTKVANDGDKLVIGTDTLYLFAENFGQYDFKYNKDGKLNAIINGYLIKRINETTTENHFASLYWKEGVTGFKVASNISDKRISAFDSYDYQGNSFGFAYPTLSNGIDNDVVFAAWSQPSVTGGKIDTTEIGTAKMNIHWNVSLNGGATWGTAQKLANTTGGLFASAGAYLTPRGTNELTAHFVFLKDTAAGCYVFAEGNRALVPYVYARVSFDKTTGTFTGVGERAVVSSPALVKPVSNSVNVPVNNLLKWRTVDYATSYQVQMSLVNNFTTQVKDTITNDTTKYIYGMQKDTKYYWRVRGINLVNNGPWSVDSFSTVRYPKLLFNSLAQNKLQFVATKVSTTRDSIISIRNSGSETLSIIGVYIDWTDTLEIVETNLNSIDDEFVVASKENNKRLKRTSSKITPALKVEDEKLERITESTTPEFSVNPVKFVLSPDSTKNITVKFTPNKIGIRKAKIIYEYRLTETITNKDTLFVGGVGIIGEPTLTTLNYPTTNAVDVAVNETFKWRNLENATSYKFQLSLVNDFTTQTKDATISDTTIYISGMHNGAKYYWRVRGTNPAGDGPWAVDSFKTVRSPNPKLLFTSLTENKLQFTATKVGATRDSVVTIKNTGEDTLKLVEVNIDSTENILIVSNNEDDKGLKRSTGSITPEFSVDPVKFVLAPGSTINVIIRFVPNRTGVRKAKIIYEYKLTESTNKKDTLFVDGFGIIEPTLTTLNYPTTNAVYIAINETFKWKKLEHATSFKFQLSLVKDFTTQIKDTTINDTTIYIRGMQNSKKYYWRVKGINIAGDGPWSVDSFKTIGFPKLVFNGLAQNKLQFPTTKIGTTSDSVITLTNSGTEILNMIGVNLDLTENISTVSNNEDNKGLQRNKSSINTILSVNTDAYNINIESISSEFTIDPVKFDLEPGSSKNVTVKFTPSKVGERNARIIYEYKLIESINRKDTLFISGFSFGEPIITLNPKQHDFGNVKINSTNFLKYELKNTGTDTLRINEVFSTHPENFFTRIAMSGLILLPGNHYQDTIIFNPKKVGLHAAHIKFKSKMLEDSIFVKGSVTGAAKMKLSVNWIDFGNVKQHISKDTSFTVTNEGDDTLKLLMRVDPPQAAGSFIVIDPLQYGIVKPGGNLKAKLKFTPNPMILGAMKGTLNIFTNTNPPNDSILLVANVATRVQFGTEIPTIYSLSQNYPNPFNPVTTIRFGLPSESNLKVEIYNSLGQLVQVLVDEVLGAYYYEVKWETGKIPSGLYFYKITAIDINNPNNKFVQTKKMVLMK